MEAWRKEFYEKSMRHHGIKGMKWGVMMGPPYPLSDEDHSAAEKKAGWKSSLSSFLKKYGSKSTDNSELLKEYLPKKGKSGKGTDWEDKFYSKMSAVSKDMNWSRGEMVNRFVKSKGNKNADEFVKMLKNSGAINEEKSKELLKPENKSQLEAMRKKVMSHYINEENEVKKEKMKERIKENAKNKPKEKKEKSSSRGSSGGGRSSGGVSQGFMGRMLAQQEPFRRKNFRQRW